MGDVEWSTIARNRQGEVSINVYPVTPIIE